MKYHRKWSLFAILACIFVGSQAEDYCTPGPYTQSFSCMIDGVENSNTVYFNANFNCQISTVSTKDIGLTLFQGNQVLQKFTLTADHPESFNTTQGELFLYLNYMYGKESGLVQCTTTSNH